MDKINSTERSLYIAKKLGRYIDFKQKRNQVIDVEELQIIVKKLEEKTQ